MVSKISKEEISKLPVANFPGRIIVLQHESEAKKAVEYLHTFKQLGFDTETRPSFKKGKTHKISLMQISTDNTCFLFRLNLLGIPEFLRNLLTDINIKIIGLSLKDDFSAIRKRTSLDSVNYVELQSYVKRFGIEDNSLQKIYAILFAEKISKSQRLSNWEADILSPAQQNYASLDAWACLQIYKKLNKLDLD